MHKKYCVYLHRRKSDDRVFYVGKGVSERPFKMSGRSKWWSSVANKHGVNVEIIKWFQSERDAFGFERSLIGFFRQSQPLVNMTNGGDGVSGLRHSDESKLKMSGPRPNAKQWLRGKSIPDDLRIKLRIAKLGKKQSPEHAAKSRTNKLGVKVIDTSKLNVDKRKPVKNCSGEIFESAADAAREISKRLGVNASQGNITMCIHGKRHTAYGMKWSFA